MTISFIHSSDWHIGKPFGRLSENVSGVLRHARLRAVERLASVARACGSRIVLVAGDVYDSARLPDRDVRAPLAAMAVHSDLTWHLIPGNHDPASAGGVWERVTGLGLPGNVMLHLEARPAEIAQAVWLLPAPLSVKSMSVDPTAWMDSSATPAGAFRIGLAHGSVQGFGSERQASIEIAPDRARRAGLTYLALGDWHGVREVGVRTAYSGTPEPDGYLDNAPGFALQVSIAGVDALPQLVRREVGEHRWIARTIDVGRPTDIVGIEQELDKLGPKALQAMMAIEVTGRVTMQEERLLRARLDTLEGKVMHLERKLERMIPSPAVGDVEALPEGGIRELALELSRMADGPGDRQAVARRAVRYLFELADEGASRGGGAQ